MNKFSNDGSFLEKFKEMNGAVSENKPKTNVEVNQRGGNSKNSLSRAFKQMSQDKILSKPKLVFDDVDRPVTSLSEADFNAKEEFNEYDATLPDVYVEPVTAKTHVVIDKLIESILEFGDDMERIILNDQKDDPEFWFLHDKKSQTYKHFQKKLADEREKMKTKKSALLRKENEVKHTTSIKAEVPTINIDTLDVPVIDSVFTPETATNKSKWEDEQSHEKSRKRKSRWGPESSSSLQLAGDNGKVVALNDDDFDMLIAMEELKRAEQEAKQKKLAWSLAQGVSYNSDEEDVEANRGTKEHVERKQEMERTELKAKEVTELNEGRTFIGDFIPNEELLKFNAQVAKAKGLPMTPEMAAALSDTSNFADHKLKQDNIGFKMLQKAGWSEGSGLGTAAQGVTAPVDVNPNAGGTMGLGMSQQLHQVSSNDDDVDIFRKRMMMAYKYRPNPMNNPRRPYY